MENLSISEFYNAILRSISEKTGISYEQLATHRNYPAVAYRHLTFAYLVGLGYTHQNIADVTGYSRVSVTCGVKAAHSCTPHIRKVFKKIMEEYE